MKKYLLLYKILFLSLPGFAQLTISSGARWVTNGNVTVNLQDMDMVNNGTFTPGTGKVKFSGDGSNGLAGSSVTNFSELEIEKSGSNTLVLFSNTGVNGKVTFTSGLIELNQKTITLSNNAVLNNENENSRITGLNGGEVIISLNMNKPNGVNPGNLGAIFTSNSNMGTVVIKRGHKEQSGNGLTGSVNRYFNIQASGKKTNASVRLEYFDVELNGQDENTMTFYQTTNNGLNWANQAFSNRDVVANWVEKTAMTSLGTLTLSNNDAPAPIVQASGNLTPEVTDVLAKKITVGPNPNNGNFWFRVSGIQKEAVAALYTIDGKIVKQFRVANLQQQQVNGLRNGMYILKVEGLQPFRIVVQGGGSQINNTPAMNNNSTKF
jgi:hypothetical protein